MNAYSEDFLLFQERIEVGDSWVKNMLELEAIWERMGKGVC